jgi:hypothetical protein
MKFLTFFVYRKFLWLTVALADLLGTAFTSLGQDHTIANPAY